MKLINPGVAGLFLLMPALVQAKSDPVFDLSLDQLMTLPVGLASLTQQERHKAPGHVIVVTQNQIQQRGYRYLNDLLQDLPGVQVYNANRADSFNSVSVRGINGNNRLVILQDGHKVSSPAGEEIALGNNYPLQGIDRVEFIYGPSSALYGADAMSAVINLITDVDASLNASIESGEDGYEYAHLGVQHAFTQDWTAQFRFNHKRLNDNDKVQEYPDYYRLDDLVFFDGRVAIPADHRQAIRLPQKWQYAQLRLSHTDKFNFSAIHNQYEHTTTLASSPTRANYDASPRWQVNMTHINMDYQHTWSEDIEGETQLAWNQYYLDPQSKFNNVFSGFKDGYKYAEDEHIRLSHHATYNMDQGTQFTAGMSLEWFDILPKTSDLPHPYDTGKESHQQDFYYPGAENSIKMNFFPLSYQNRAGFLLWQQQWSDSLSSLIGLRHDHNTEYGRSTNPRAVLVYQASNNTSLKLTYGEAFLAPAPQWKYEHFGQFRGQNEQGQWQSNFFTLPNPDLEPERSRTFEASLSHQLNASWGVELSAYSQALEDIIFSQTTDPAISDYFEQADIRRTVQNTNIGELKSWGADLSVQFIKDLSQASIHSYASVSWGDGELRRPKERAAPLPFHSRTMAKFGISLEMENLTLHTRGQWQTGPYAPNQGAHKEHQLASYFTLDGFAEYQLPLQGFSTSLRITNLLDKRYFAPSDDDNDIGYFAIPQSGRRLQLGIHYRY